MLVLVTRSDRLARVLELAAELPADERAELVELLVLQEDAESSSPEFEPADDNAIPLAHLDAVQESLDDPAPSAVDQGHRPDYGHRRRA